jgi:hypothetical protein
MQASYRPRGEARVHSQSIDRSEGTHSPAYAFVADCSLNTIQTYINARVAAIAFARRAQVWPRTLAQLEKRSVISLLSVGSFLPYSIELEYNPFSSDSRESSE